MGQHLSTYLSSEEHKHINEQFCNLYRDIAQRINLPLADLSDPTKSFICKKQGVLLGIYYDTTTLTWSLPTPKHVKTHNFLVKLLNKSNVTENDLQKTVGLLNIFSSLNYTLKALRGPLIEDLKRATKHGDSISLDPATIADLHRWLVVLSDSVRGLPIQQPLNNFPPIESITITTGQSQFV